jgi:hypothetical protein
MKNRDDREKIHMSTGTEKDQLAKDLTEFMEGFFLSRFIRGIGHNEGYHGMVLSMPVEVFSDEVLKFLETKKKLV